MFFVNGIIMNSLPFPNEIISIIYQYIHPIFEYEDYHNALIKHNEERRCFLSIVHNNWNIEDINDRIISNDIISTYSLLMNEYLLKIQEFIEGNRLFKRPYINADLKTWQFKTMWQYSYEKNTVLSIDNQIYNFKSKEKTPFIRILQKGDLWELVNECSINNIQIAIPESVWQDESSKNLFCKTLKKILMSL